MRANRLGETLINNFGSEMIIVEYRKNTDIDVYFPEYDWTAKHIRYQYFQKGCVKCPYERNIYGIGYLGEGPYKTIENGKANIAYSTWHRMFQRCYDFKLHIERPTYIDCKVCEEWHNFQNFAKWYEENYYEVPGQTMCLDKDILVKGNKIYSPDTCVFVPNNINLLFTKRNADRGDLPIGVSHIQNKYRAYCKINNKQKSLGTYNTPEEAFQAYKEFKENYIQTIADEYQDQIPQELYEAMLDYEIDIND